MDRFNTQCSPNTNDSSRVPDLKSVEIQMTRLCMMFEEISNSRNRTICNYRTHQEVSSTTTGPLFPKPICQQLVSSFPVWKSKQYLSLPTHSQSGSCLTCQRAQFIAGESAGMLMEGLPAAGWITLLRGCLWIAWWQHWWCLYSFAMPGALGGAQEHRAVPGVLLQRVTQKHSPPNCTCWQGEDKVNIAMATYLHQTSGWKEDKMKQKCFCLNYIWVCQSPLV